MVDKKVVNNKKEVVNTHPNEKLAVREAGYNLSWGAVFAGIVTFLALLLTFSLINAALGLAQFDPTQANPFNNVGTGQAIWTVVAFVLAFLGAGFVSGLTARRLGFIHGFLTWAGGLIVSIIFLVWIASQALSMAGNVVSTTANVAGDAVTSVASTATDAVSQGVNALSDNIDVSQADIDEFNQNINDILEDTDIPELQPDYISSQIEGATTDITNAAQEIVVNPDNSDQVFSDLADSLTTRVDSIAENVDEEAVANAVESNTDLSQEEAEEATQNIVEGYNQAASNARQGIQNASDQIDQTRQDLSQSIDQLRTDTNQATNSAAGGSVWAFVAVVLGAVISALGGTLGVNSATRRWINEKHA